MKEFELKDRIGYAVILASAIAGFAGAAWRGPLFKTGALKGFQALNQVAAGDDSPSSVGVALSASLPPFLDLS